MGFIVYDDFAMWQVALLHKFLKNAGYEIETLSIEGGEISTDGGVGIYSKSLIGSKPNEYDLLLFPGGNVTEDLIDNKPLMNFLQTYKGVVAASCASSAIVAGAGLIKGKFTCVEVAKERFSKYFSSGTYIDADVCVDHNIITSKGHAHFEFMMTVLREVGVLRKDPRVERVALKLGKNE
ncbi:DJ-1/PfpI family protein [Fredinandcohnia sp. 179-A 10B2 NHS]|uniref:DJ-1/PfpI family protein n=1 Tax=Fredinandcohnia sp. 179-A 10B2 NHS TaxID=3235176 RepID=UPI00399F3A5F